jgi:uroporphyrinogen III methyltransferase/synthase
VSLRDTLNWFERRPLFGQTVAVTRTRQQASEVVEKLEALGANVIEAPTIQIQPAADRARVAAALLDMNYDRYDWAVFTSANAVTRTRELLWSENLDARAFWGTAVAAVGDATAAALEKELFLRPDLVPPQALAESLADALVERGQVKGKRFLLLRADIGRPVLVERLRQGAAAQVDDVAVYETRPADALPQPLLDALDAGELNWATFTSSSTARNFAALLGPDHAVKLRGVKLASIGPVTTATLRELCLEPTVQAETSDVDGLVAALVAASAGTRGQ